MRLAPPLALTPRLAHPTRPRPDRDPRPRATADTDATPPSHGANGLREASSSEAPPLGWLPRRKRIAQLSGRLAVAFRVRRDVPDFASFIPRLLHQQLLPTELGGGARRVGPGLEFAGDGAGRLLHAAAIFSDASGFTALTERLAQQPNGAEVMCRTMNRFLSAMINIIHSYGGDVVKFAGDALLVVFPIDAAQVPRCACHATVPPRARALHALHGSCVRAVPAHRASARVATLTLHHRMPCTPRSKRLSAAAAAAAAPAAAATAPPPQAAHGYFADERSATITAAACAHQLATQLHQYEAYKDAAGVVYHLSLHIGVGCGELVSAQQPAMPRVVHARHVPLH